MKNKTVFTLLGTGSSGGVPRIGNNWGACDPEDPRNRRRRCSLLVERSNSDGKTSVLIDTGPDMREQLLSARVNYLDAVFLTHAHADHITGLDDLRQLAVAHKEKVNVYLDAPTTASVMRAFGYCFQQAEGSSYPAICQQHNIIPDEPIHITGDGGTITAIPFIVNHGDIKALGFRFDDLVYLPDVKTVTEASSLAALKNVDTLILDALRYSPHPTHMNVEEALAFMQQIKPARGILTDMHGELDYKELASQLPDNIEPAYDGMTISYTTP